MNVFFTQTFEHAITMTEIVHLGIHNNANALTLIRKPTNKNRKYVWPSQLQFGVAVDDLCKGPRNALL